MELDSENCQILQLLQKNCRMTLTEMSKSVGLSVDSIKKRIDKMIQSGIFYPKIQLRPRNFGYSNVVDIKIKIGSCAPKEFKGMTSYLTAHPNVAELFRVSGEWDLSMVVIARDAIHLGKLMESFRSRFNRIIISWSASLTVDVHKFEEYDMPVLLGITKQES